jgi:hypothetical protein
MDPRMLRYYNEELAYMREMGAEFAGQFPKVAARLALEATEVADPYVERLLEGFSFLTARIRLKLDAEFPRFTQHLLEMAYPHYVAPTPSMAIAQFLPSMSEGALASGFRVPRGTLLRGQIPRKEETACQFRTAHEVTPWPLEIADVRYWGSQPWPFPHQLMLGFTAQYAGHEIEIDGTVEQDSDVRFLGQNRANGLSDVRRGKTSRGDLIEQRLEKVMVLPINNRDASFGVIPFLAKGESSEARAQHYDVWIFRAHYEHNVSWASRNCNGTFEDPRAAQCLQNLS